MRFGKEAETEAPATVAENLNLPSKAPEFMFINEMNVNFGTREIFVAGEIDADFGPWFTGLMSYLAYVGPGQPVTVWLNTYGGDVNSMFVYHDIVRAAKFEVNVIAVGQVCSAGVLMLACGHNRYVTENCILMSHRGEDGMHGNLEQLEARMKYVKWSEERWAELMARYSPDYVDGVARDAKYWFALGKKRSEWWVFGGEAIVHEGLADAVYALK